MANVMYESCFEYLRPDGLCHILYVTFASLSAAVFSWSRKMAKGATIWARKTIDSDMFSKPHVWFKIWFFLVSHAQHKDYKQLNRGQCWTSYPIIQEQCSATKNEVDHAIRYMKKEQMLATRKATRGMVVTICNYDTYQDLNYYKSDSKSDSKATEKRHDKQECCKNERMKENGASEKTERYGDLKIVRPPKEWYEQQRKRDNDT